MEPVNPLLYRASRPGYPSHVVSLEEVQHWCRKAKNIGIKTILCLLAEEQLAYYNSVPNGLLEYYRSQGFEVIHHPVQDHLKPPIPPECLPMICADYRSAAKPVLVHCSAGMDRTGGVVSCIESNPEAS